MLSTPKAITKAVLNWRVLASLWCLLWCRAPLLVRMMVDWIVVVLVFCCCLVALTVLIGTFCSFCWVVQENCWKSVPKETLNHLKMPNGGQWPKRNVKIRPFYPSCFWVDHNHNNKMNHTQQLTTLSSSSHPLPFRCYLSSSLCATSNIFLEAKPIKSISKINKIINIYIKKINKLHR